jgi:hypothetical protein
VRRKPKAEVVCESCSGVFAVHSYRAKTARFCSVKCHNDVKRYWTDRIAAGDVAELRAALLDALDLSPDGGLTWKRNTGGRGKAGERAGWITRFGYERIALGNVEIFSHRAIFLMSHGYLPAEIDHIDGDGLNNRPENLRAATSVENKWNTGLASHNKSGFKGVSFDKGRGQWVANINVRGAHRYIGAFDDPAEAASAYDAAAHRYHGGFAKTNEAMGLLA